ncbi:MAG: DUF4405 domain-containing protein [Candidatus Electrothrix sp. AR4]|nr:DUF4405 domain-containing protein [Candidatus Electrothrix sp. AR4]
MRKTTSLLLVISGFIELITSIFLYMAPSGRIAYWHNYRLLWINRAQWRDIHLTVGTLFLLTALMHIYYNWRPIVTYLKYRSKRLTILNKNFNIALLLSLYFTVGTLYSLPPMRHIIQFGKYLTVRGSKMYSEPPFHHAERSSFEKFCTKMKINTESAAELLKRANITVDDFKKTMEQIAKQNNRSPQQLYEIIKPIIVPRKKGGH